MYKLIRKLLFLLPPEEAHHLSLFLLQIVCSTPLTRRLLRKLFEAPNATPVTIAGLSFKNKVGLAAGFDKNALHLRELSCLGFGHVEIGTVTPQPQRGNERPRLFRLPQDRALINRMGFNNDGVVTIARRLKQWREEIQPRVDGTPALIIVSLAVILSPIALIISGVGPMNLIPCLPQISANLLFSARNP